ncbi:MAG TPA: type II toxin-antitoxin system HicB family antitoxin [Armatimonadota bacterium]|nr:type II toxin-antitoxin system HicB family antitoxin [Armatimonadota bacterium]
MMQRFSASIWQEDGWYVAQCHEVDIASQGRTREEALTNLREAIQLHFTPPVATIPHDVASIEVDLHAA